jgi:hypothetical protein
MSAKDDFCLWERELQRDRLDADVGTGGRGMLLVASLTALGCTALIVFGYAPLGVTGLVVSSLILLLWRAGW